MVCLSNWITLHITLYAALAYRALCMHATISIVPSNCPLLCLLIIFFENEFIIWASVTKGLLIYSLKQENMISRCNKEGVSAKTEKGPIMVRPVVGQSVKTASCFVLTAWDKLHSALSLLFNSQYQSCN